MLLDSDGAFRHWKYPGAYSQQPYIDICIYKIIRAKWVELRNEDINKSTKSSQISGVGGRKIIKSFRR